MASYFEVQSDFQHINIVNDGARPGGHILYLDRMWQYNSTLEYRYHETIASLPLSVVEMAERVLVCGGGDGLAVRELLKYKEVKCIDLVEIDPMMTRLYSTKEMLTSLNQRSLLDLRTNVHNIDAREFAKGNQDSYDMVILDFPSPGSANETKQYPNLYSVDNLAMFAGCLRSWGVLACQTSIKTRILVPFARWLLENRFFIWNLDVSYEKAGSHDNFSFASKQYLGKQQRPLPNKLRFITMEHIKIGFSSTTEIKDDGLDYCRLFLDSESSEVD